MLNNGMIRNPLEWMMVAVFALVLISAGGIIIGLLINLIDGILERRKKVK